MAGIPIPRKQDLTFKAALCQRVGVDPENVSRVDVSTDGRGDCEVVIYTHLPEAEVTELFNAAGRS